MYHTSIFLVTILSSLSLGADGYDHAISVFLEKRDPDTTTIMVLRADQERAVRFFLEQLDAHNRHSLAIQRPIATKLGALVLGNKAFHILPMKWNEAAAQQLESGLVKLKSVTDRPTGR